LDEKSETRYFKIIEKGIRKTGSSTREELSDAFRSAGIENKDNRYAHILLRAEIAGLICSGQEIEEKKLLPGHIIRTILKEAILL
jgi:hypothetical protein